MKINPYMFFMILFIYYFFWFMNFFENINKGYVFISKFFLKCF